MKQILLLFILLISPPLKEWKAAVQFADQNNSRWAEIFESLDCDAKECEAIVFPEILRYNRFVDLVQTSVLLGNYVKGGIEKSNFSIGPFQMKPSFVEQIEKDWNNSKFAEKYQLTFDISDNKDSRLLRVRRLENIEWQCVYIAVFVKLMLEKHPYLKEMDNEQRLRYLATAYNYSYNASRNQIEIKMKEKNFHLDFVKLKKTKLYNYSELSIQRYKQ